MKDIYDITWYNKIGDGTGMDNVVFYQDGFRDGIDAGKEASLQQGFNLGYREGADKMKAIGQFKGIVR